MNILLVCTGNTCRSTMAEALLKHLIKENKQESNFNIKSAGLAAVDDTLAASNAITAMSNYGIDINGFRSSRINNELLKADLILTMTTRHKNALIAYDLKLKEKTFTLKEYAGETKDLDIIDPYGQSIEVYIETAKELNKYLKAIWDKKLRH